MAWLGARVSKTLGFYLRIDHYSTYFTDGYWAVSPAMAAGVTVRLWEVSDLAALLDARDAAIATQKRGPYKKQQTKIAL